MKINKDIRSGIITAVLGVSLLACGAFGLLFLAMAVYA